MVEDNGLGNLLMGFILILVGVVLIGTIADSIKANITLEDKPNESITISSTDHIITEEIIEIISGAGQTGNISLSNVTYFGNITINTSVTGISVNTEVNWTVKGGILVSQLNFSSDDNYTISYIYTTDGIGATVEDDLTALNWFGNGTIHTGLATISINTDVNWTEAGVITVNTLNFSDSSLYNISYTYEGDGYVTNTTARVLLPLVTLFFAIAVMLIGVFVGKKGLEKMGLF